MNTIRALVFLLITMFASYSFATENSENQSQCNCSIFNAYLTVKEVHDQGLVLLLDDGSQWDINYFGYAKRLEPPSDFVSHIKK